MQKPVENHLPEYRVRPRFEIESPYTVKEITDKIKTALREEGATCKATVYDGYATLYIPHAAQHYWSPQLTLSVEATEKGSLLRGLYGPRPSVWTMFVFFYSLLAFAILVISIIGFSNWSLGKSCQILYFVPILSLLFLSLYLTAYFGQKMGHDQMVVLHTFVEESIGMRIEN